LLQPDSLKVTGDWCDRSSFNTPLSTIIILCRKPSLKFLYYIISFYIGDCPAPSYNTFLLSNDCQYVHKKTLVFILFAGILYLYLRAYTVNVMYAM
jgi:hypothetical protein